MIYDVQKQKVQAGGSGCGCSAVVTYGHLLKRVKQGELKRILVCRNRRIAVPISYQQGESIPCIAHAVAMSKSTLNEWEQINYDIVMGFSLLGSNLRIGAADV